MVGFAKVEKKLGKAHTNCQTQFSTKRNTFSER